MGAINYSTNKILTTIGYNLKAKDQIEAYWLTQIKDVDDAMNEADNQWVLDQEDDFNQVKAELDDYEFYEIKVKPGYYEGFYISIKNKYVYLDNFYQHNTMQKELTKLSKQIVEFIENHNMVVCSPGWCTSWCDKKESLAKWTAAVREERKRIAKIPTEFTVFHKMSKEERKKLIGW